MKRARAKYLAIMRTRWRLQQRLDTIDHEYDVILPGLQKLEQRITVVGELPQVDISVEGEDGDELAGSDLPPPPSGA